MDTPYLERLYNLARELNIADNIKTILDTITDHLPKVLEARYCSLFVKNPASGGLELKAHNHKDIGQDPFINITSEQESIMNLALARNSSLLIRDIEEEIGIANKEKYSTKSFMSILITHDNEIKGVLNLADKGPDGFNKDDMLVVSTIAELLGALLNRIDLSKI
ncbi:MAG: GAF domain-containing protein [Deltaproteobacteria bacterium]|nr:GAF domain-containing protein [Deltaproteobacteria bacterium]